MKSMFVRAILLSLCLVLGSSFRRRDLIPIGCTQEGASWCKFVPVQGVLSYDVEYDAEAHRNFDMFLNLFSTIGGPSMLQTHVVDNADWSGFAKADAATATDAEIAKAATQPTDAAGAAAVSAGGTGFVGHSGSFFMGMSFPNIIEFEDTNGDLKYGPEDTLVVSHSLAGAPDMLPNGVAGSTYSAYKEWGGFKFDKWIEEGQAQAMAWSAGWKGSEFIPADALKIRFRLADGEITMDDGVHLNPNCTKIDFTMKDFPKQSATSFLALEGWVASASNVVDISVDKDVDSKADLGSIHWGENGFVKWDTECKAEEGVHYDSVTVRHGGWEDAVGTAANGNFAYTGSFWKQINGFKETVDSTTSVKKTYFTFSSGGKPTNNVYWDPLIQYGPDVPEGSGGVVGLVFGLVAGFAILAGLGYYCWTSRKKEAAYAPIGDGYGATEAHMHVRSGSQA